MSAEIIGWAAAVVLLLTISRQVYVEWRNRSTRGLSRWLFVGQLAASAGFITYSWIVDNWVFVVTNFAMLVTAGVGQWIYTLNRRREQKLAGTRKNLAS